MQTKNITTAFTWAGYQKVEWIESSGTQWIDTGLQATNQTKFQIRIIPLEQQGDVIFGYHGGSDVQDYRIFNASGNLYLDLPGGSGSGNRIIQTGGWPTNSDYQFEGGNFYVKYVGSSSNIISGSTVGSFTTGGTLKLNKGSNSIAKTRCYYIKIRTGTTQEREMFPAYRKSDNVIGMYDVLHKQFYTNQGTGNFTKGPNA